MSNEEFLVLFDNPKIKPSFSEDTVVSLTKDYTEISACYSKYLKKGVYCIIIECGLSKYPGKVDEQTNSWITPIDTDTDGVEWCTVRIITQEVDPDNEEDFVRAKDLQPYIPL